MLYYTYIYMSRLQLQFGPWVRDHFLAAPGEKLPASLQRLRLNFARCSQIGDGGVAALGGELPASL